MSEQGLPAQEWHPSKAEQYKAIYEFLKHTATLSAGSVLLIATMLEKLFAHPLGRRYVAIAVGAFLGSLATSCMGFFVTAVLFPRANGQQPGEVSKNVMAASVALTCILFVVGVGAIAFFFWTNW